MTAAIDAYDAFARRIVESGVITDPWIDGAPRFREQPVILSRAGVGAMYRAAEDIAAVYDELCLIVAEQPALLDDFFRLTAYQKAMWLASHPLWHGIARADVFVTDEGLAVAELNCDTPTGEAEAVVLSAIAVSDVEGAIDPNRDLGSCFAAMVEELAARTLSGDAPRAVGFVYPTEFTEDLALVRLYRRWFEERGYEVILGSPYNLGYGPSGPLLFDRPFSIMLRHYKTDWWGERSSVWDDEGIPDAEPLEKPLHAALAGLLERRAAIINPFGAVLPQNKRSMAFMWEQIHRFSPRAQEVIQRHVPVTSRLEALHKEQLLAQREEWVIKSDYGAEGEEVILGCGVSDEVWRASLAHARKGRWIAQRYFKAQTTAAGEAVNHGVYLVAGRAAGIYARVQAGATDDHAVSAPVLMKGS
jgi:glutathionylspermidine synthase